MKIEFLCNACGTKSGNEAADFDEFEICAYEDAVEWSDSETDIPPLIENGHWYRSEKAPSTSENRIVRVGHPFSERQNGEFWTLYKPALSSLNGWDEHPEEIERSAFIKCQIIAAVHSNDRYAWLQVEVLECILLPDATIKFPQKSQKTSFAKKIHHFDTSWVTTFGQWEFYQGNGQSDLGNWAIFLKSEADIRIVAFGEWGIHQNTAYMGNLIISKDTYNQITKGCKVI